MTEKMFKWFSTEGVKRAPVICPINHLNMDKAKYRILFSQTPMRTVSQTTHGYETRQVTEPFNANVNTHLSYSNGDYAYGTATINGDQSSTIVIPTETTISRSSVVLYMYTYRVLGNQFQLISTDSVVFTRVAAIGSGENAAGAELGAGLGNLIRASVDHHRIDKLYEEALNAILADVQYNGTKEDQLPESHTTDLSSAPLPAPVAPHAALLIAATTAQISLNIDSTPPGGDIEIDGAFVGNTPSTITVDPRSHQVVIKKKGFNDWSKTLNVTGGMIHLNVELEKSISQPPVSVPLPPPPTN